MGVLAVSKKNEFNAKINDNELVIVDFSATWCGPCKMISPVFEELSTKYDNITFLKVDGDDSPDIVKDYEISGFPTFLFFQNGKLNKDLTVVGAYKADLEQKVDNFSKK